MRCPQCGHDNSASARFCASCGAMLLPAPDASLRPGQTMNNGQYRIVRQLGKGGMGAIYIAQNTQAFDRLCVIKEMIAYYEPGQEQDAQRRFEQEARTLAALKHPGIPDMYGYFSERGHNYIVMEYIEGQNLEQAIGHDDATGASANTLDVERAVRYGVEICRVLEYLATIQPEPVVHCDIKPANIIIDQNSQQAVLVDFGTAKVRYQPPVHSAPDAKRDSVYGTVGYAPPEQYQGKAVPKSDVYALAATLYHVLTGDDPREHPFKWPALERLPGPLALILRRALENDVAQRIDAGELRRQLEAYRAAQSTGLLPLVFPDGNLASTLTGVLDLSLRYWEYARRILYDGSLDVWLRQNLRDPDAADRVLEAVQEYPNLPDAGLDLFVRALNPRLPPPQLELKPASIDLGTLAAGEQKAVELLLSNSGPGGARGALQSSAAWLRLPDRQYALAPGGSLRLLAMVDTTGLKGSGTQSAQLTVTENGGARLSATLRLKLVAGQRRQTSARPQPISQPAPSRPKAARGKTGWILGLLLLVIGVTLLVTYWPTVLPEPSYERGLEALRAGRWEEAVRELRGLDAEQITTVYEVAALLDDAMASLPAGALLMGSDIAIDAWPAQTVPVVAFSLDRFEVTNAQYQRFVDQGHRAPPSWRDGRFSKGQALWPVVGVTWEDALAYARWANKRLPSEAEWEWAARGAEARLYPWGNQGDAARANIGSSQAGAARPKSLQPVGSYPTGASPEGVYDLVGNAREWTADGYVSTQTVYQPGVASANIAVRGGSWKTILTPAFDREAAPKDSAADDLGFRCAR